MNAPHGTRVAPAGELRISILHVTDCPSVSRLRTEVEEALQKLGVTAVLEEIKGAFPSPTLLIDAGEVDGYPQGPDAACRINLPTSDEITAAILAACTRRARSLRREEVTK